MVITWSLPFNEVNIIYGMQRVCVCGERRERGGGREKEREEKIERERERDGEMRWRGGERKRGSIENVRERENVCVHSEIMTKLAFLNNVCPCNNITFVDCILSKYTCQ